MLSVYRKEIKYVIPLEAFVSIEGQLDLLMKRDSYGENGTYRVRSQYYDSLTDRDLWDNLSGVMEKRKIRLRIYSPEDQRVKLEYKCKSGSDGEKYSLNISREEASLMEDHRYEFLLGREESLAAQLYARMAGGTYRPRTIVEYQRTAFTYPVSDTRITYDHEIMGSVNPYGLFEKQPFYTPLLQPDVGILEVKYNDFLPPQLKAAVSRIDGLAEASSKYSKARLAYI